MANTPTRTVRVPDDLWAEVVALGEQDDRPTAWEVNVALAEYVARRKSESRGSGTG